MTNDLNNLSLQSEYLGDTKVTVGNGAGLNVQHIGSSYLNSSPSSPIVFELTNLLHVPKITKNLISVSQFTKDNHVYFEFHPSLCFVTSLATNQVLLQGKLHEGLYQIALDKAHPKQFILPNCNSSPHISLQSPVPQSLVVSTNSDKNNMIFLWHNRLGHPNIKIVQNVLRSCNIPVQINKPISLCHDCAISKCHNLPFSESLTQYTFPLQLIVADVWGDV